MNKEMEMDEDFVNKVVDSNRLQSKLEWLNALAQQRDELREHGESSELDRWTNLTNTKETQHG